MDNSTATIEMLFEKAGDYSQTTTELLKFKASDTPDDEASSLAVRLAIFMVVVLFTLIINVGILWIGEEIGTSYFGVFMVAAFCVLLISLLYVFRHQWIKNSVSNSIITQLLKKSSSH